MQDLTSHRKSPRPPPLDANSCTSPPAQKFLPAPRTCTTRTPASLLQRRTACCSAFIRLIFIPLDASGRLRVIVAIWSAKSRRTGPSPIQICGVSAFITISSDKEGKGENGPGVVHQADLLVDQAKDAVHQPQRSEEHTSEIQSLMRTSYAVLRLK